MEYGPGSTVVFYQAVHCADPGNVAGEGKRKDMIGREAAAEAVIHGPRVAVEDGQADRFETLPHLSGGMHAHHISLPELLRRITCRSWIDRILQLSDGDSAVYY